MAISKKDLGLLLGTLAVLLGLGLQGWALALVAVFLLGRATR